MSSSNDPSLPLITITRNRPTNSNIVRTQRTTERSIGCNTDASPTDPSRKTEIDEEDELTDIIEQLIHEFLARPSRRQPYKNINMGQSSSMSSDSSTSSMQDLDTNMSSSSTSSSYIPYTAGRTTAAIVPSSTFPGVDVVVYEKPNREKSK
ncbi:unnamed protein product [Rotaria magnacalcarata]|uniref:Uncharacterized protein n=6 Tax=Rotaria TaxID=231623 RepID=A0A816RQA9_9BILA|nr:unnamed protein product [Rotaria magnacalcarata]